MSEQGPSDFSLEIGGPYCQYELISSEPTDERTRVADQKIIVQLMSSPPDTLIECSVPGCNFKLRAKDLASAGGKCLVKSVYGRPFSELTEPEIEALSEKTE